MRKGIKQNRSAPAPSSAASAPAGRPCRRRRRPSAVRHSPAAAARPGRRRSHPAAQIWRDIDIVEAHLKGTCPASLVSVTIFGRVVGCGCCARFGWLGRVVDRNTHYCACVSAALLCLRVAPWPVSEKRQCSCQRLHGTKSNSLAVRSPATPAATPAPAPARDPTPGGRPCRQTAGQTIARVTRLRPTGRSRCRAASSTACSRTRRTAHRRCGQQLLVQLPGGPACPGDVPRNLQWGWRTRRCPRGVHTPEHTGPLHGA